MPNHRSHAKVKGTANSVKLKEDVKNNNDNEHVHVAQKSTYNDNSRPPTGMAKCCLPTGCTENFINISQPGDAVKVICNNENCTVGNWMHASCFEIWESSVLSYLRSCGRARSWSEKQRLQNLWTKKGYDLAYKACDCKCARGHLRKDLDYFVKPTPTEIKPKKKNKKRSERTAAVTINQNHQNNHIHNNNHIHSTINQSPVFETLTTSSIDNIDNNNHTIETEPVINGTDDNNGNTTTVQSSSAPELNGNVRHSAPMSLSRLRAGSFSSSSGSSPPSAGSDSPAPMSPGVNGFHKQNGFDFFCEGQQPNVQTFKHRLDMSAFCGLPRHKQNSYHIKMEDETPFGNDETRCFVLTNLSSYKVTSIECVLCKIELPVFDHYPLIDGTFFLSPQPYSDGVVQLMTDNKIQYLNAVCVNCLEGWTDVRCYACKSKWDGRILQVGTMYSYDIFAAMPCCQKRLTCKACHRAVVDINRGLPFYSEYSCSIECPYCKAKDTHFIRPLSETFNVKPTNSIWKC